MIDTWEDLTDPEQAFTLPVPRGWQNRSWVDRRGARLATLTTCTDGITTLFLGDARLPQFMEPGWFPSPGAIVRPFVSIEHFLPDYARDRFGPLGLAIRDLRPAPDLYQHVARKLVASGAQQIWVTAGRLEFELADGLRGLLFGFTVQLPPLWSVDILGVVTQGDPAPFEASLLGMYANRRATPAMHQRQMAERSASAQQHAATMAMIDQNTALLRANHQRSMATLDAMGAAHQARMDGLHQTFDAANAAWSQQERTPEPTSDDAHRRFLNLIAEERTVVDSEGATFQVADGYDRYFRRRSDDTWIGTRSNQDLSGVPGINPADFEELRIKR